jgi:hypothetical protein
MPKLPFAGSGKIGFGNFAWCIGRNIFLRSNIVFPEPAGAGQCFDQPGPRGSGKTPALPPRRKLPGVYLPSHCHARVENAERSQISVTQKLFHLGAPSRVRMLLRGRSGGTQNQFCRYLFFVGELLEIELATISDNTIARALRHVSRFAPPPNWLTRSLSIIVRSFSGVSSPCLIASRMACAAWGVFLGIRPRVRPDDSPMTARVFAFGAFAGRSDGQRAWASASEKNTAKRGRCGISPFRKNPFGHITSGRARQNSGVLIVSFLGSKPSSSDEERLEPFFGHRLTP